MAGPHDWQQAATTLEAQLRATPRAARPYEYGTIAVRLGLTYAEAPTGDRTANLRRALDFYEKAAEVFDPRYDPVEHARVMTLAGAAQGALGDPALAARLFEKAVGLLDGRDRDDELAAALNNLGLARGGMGQPAKAIEVFDRAVDLFASTTADGRRGRVATLVNRGQAHASLGTDEGLEAALADYEQARSEVDPEEAPFHYGLVHHSLGVACSALAAARPAERHRLYEEAVPAFTESLTVFT
ncbi:MAG: tetratricopeptide repeat protein, partial [Acidimicrobiales bacterium]